MIPFTAWRGWLMAISAIVGFGYGALTWLGAIQLWRDGTEPGYDAYIQPPAWHVLLAAALLILGAVAVAGKKQPLVLIAGWTLIFGETVYELLFFYVPSLRAQYGIPPPDLRAVLNTLAALAFPLAGALLALTAWLRTRMNDSC